MTRAGNRDSRVDRYVKRIKRRPCKDCGKRYGYYVMQLDHVPERGAKLFGLSKIRRHSIGEVKREIRKCDVVCANCHAKRTHRRATHA